jgi:hypothetical protein
MPVVNAYYRDPKYLSALEAASQSIQSYVAEQLTCGDRTLQPNEVSVRLLEARGKSMQADVEIDILAASYKERVEQQDEICRNVKKFVLDNMPDLKDANVWLVLSELGHSHEDPS